MDGSWSQVFLIVHIVGSPRHRRDSSIRLPRFLPLIIDQLTNDKIRSRTNRTKSNEICLWHPKDNKILKEMFDFENLKGQTLFKLSRDDVQTDTIKSRVNLNNLIDSLNVKIKGQANFEFLILMI